MSADALPDRKSAAQHLALVIELPCMYTDDIDGLREFKFDDQTESDFILNCIGEPGIVRLRMEGERARGTTRGAVARLRDQRPAPDRRPAR